MNFITVLRSASLVLLAAFTIHAQAHGSQGYAPDSYYRITNDTTQATDLSTNSKIRLPVGGAQALLVVNPQSIVDGAVGFNAGNGLVISRLRQHREAEVWLIKFL
jgi:hypothetical protein